MAGPAAGKRRFGPDAGRITPGKEPGSWEHFSVGQESNKVRCATCGQDLDGHVFGAAEVRPPCSKCDSVARELAVKISEEISGWDTVGVRGGRRRYEPGGRKRPYVEAVFGKRQLTVSTGHVAARTKVENRRDDLYSEVVKNVETGEILHECHEPLSEHKGHGTARHNQFPRQ